MPPFPAHGAADPTVPPVAPSGFSIADTWLSGWGRRNGCTEPPLVSEEGGVVDTRYRGCAANADVRLLMVGGLDHTWWALANDEIADFLEAHPSPG